MKLNLNTKRARIEMIPLLDMIFLVLVSFVYTFLSMTIQRGIPVRLPFAATSLESKEEYLIVSVNEAGEVFINKQKVNARILKAELMKEKRAHPDVKIFLNADKMVLYDKVIEILDAIRKAGIEKVSLETAEAHE